METAVVEGILREVLHSLRRSPAERRHRGMVQVNEMFGDGELIAILLPEFHAQFTPPINCFMGRKRKRSTAAISRLKAVTIAKSSGSGNDS